MPSWWASLRRAVFPSEQENSAERDPVAAARLDPQVMRTLVERVTMADTDEVARDAAERALAFLGTQCSLLKRQAKGYPATPIRGDVWMDGTSVALWSDRLADDLERRGATALEERARLLAVSATCEVMGHYPEEVFPRVLCRARCNERLGRIPIAVQSYRAIVRDFEQLGLEAELLGTRDADDALDGAERVTLEAVDAALRRLVELAPADVPPELLARVGRRLRATRSATGHG